MTDDSNGQWVSVGAIGDIPEEEMVAVTVGGEEIALYHLKGGEFSATCNICTHGLARLTDGWMTDEGLVECPICGSSAVSKQIMSPAVAGTKAQKSAPAVDPKMREMMMTAMGEVRKHVEDNFDNVGDAFAKEARAIHEGKAEDRGIYGQATPKEVRDLVEDGVPVAPLPPEPLKKSEVN